MIKKYNDFILEKLNQSEFDRFYDSFMSVDGGPSEYYVLQGKPFFTKCRKELANKIKALGEYYDDYYSQIAKKLDADPEKDFNEMQKVIDRTGYTTDIISKLFNRKLCDFYNESFFDFFRVNGLDDIGGYIDVYLYYISQLLDREIKNHYDQSTAWLYTQIEGDNSKVNLAGDGTVNDIMGENGEDREIREYIMKYAYGYHKTPYGKLFLKNIGMTTEKFLDGVESRMLDYLKLSVEDYIKSSLDRGYSFDWSTLEIKNYVLVEDDRLTIYYNELFKDFEKLLDEDNFVGRDKWKLKRLKGIDEDYIKKLILTGLSFKNILKIDDVGGYFVIY